MLELAALGLLMHESLHGYRLKQQLEIFMGSCLSANYGAIYPLLRRLEGCGFVEALPVDSAEASTRRMFAITDRGRDRWQQKMLETPRESWVNSRSRFLIKACFFGDLSPQLRLELIESRLAICCQRLTQLQSQTVQAMNVDLYRSLAIQRALDLLQSEVEWLNCLVDHAAKSPTAGLSGNRVAIASAPVSELASGVQSAPSPENSMQALSGSLVSLGGSK